MGERKQIAASDPEIQFPPNTPDQSPPIHAAELDFEFN